MSTRKSGPPRVWQRMLSGRRLNLMEPSALDIELEDIAHGLARVARWNGQTSGDEIFSVAEHSLLVERIAMVQTPALSRTTRLAMLLHDGAEYVIGDMITPFKAVIGVTYKEVEARISRAILQRFGAPPLNGLQHKLLKAADTTAAYYEAVALAGFLQHEALALFGAPQIAMDAVENMLTPCGCAKAKERFMARARDLMEE